MVTDEEEAGEVTGQAAVDCTTLPRMSVMQTLVWFRSAGDGLRELPGHRNSRIRLIGSPDRRLKY